MQSGTLARFPFLSFQIPAPWWGVGLSTLGLALCVKPTVLAHRFGPSALAAEQLAPHLGAAFIMTGLAMALWQRLPADPLRTRLQALLAAAIYGSLTLAFLDWHIDDAAITYAYSENLVRGFGLVIHPRHAPEEAYSSTLWMLLMAGLRWCGMDVAHAAKLLATGFGSLTVYLVFQTMRAALGRPLDGAAFTVGLAGLCCSPFLIWTVSGLEHCLQATIMVGYVWAALTEPRLLRVGPWLGMALVLLRPEAPALIACVVLVLALDDLTMSRSLRAVLKYWPLAVWPALALAGLLVFRLWYFGDLLPNPFYAKVEGSPLLRVLNPLSAGYTYALDWLSRGAGLVLVVPVIWLGLRELPRSMRVGLALIAGQVFFVLYAGGDWMSQWRFLAAPIAVLSLLAGYTLGRAAESSPEKALRFAVFAALALGFCNLRLLVDFRANPTTPYASVTSVGNTFVGLAQKLGIERPLLAHHDAGGISFRARLELLDLGGLGDRIMAKHMNDGRFLREYILARRPDFVFGTGSAFAAGSSHFQDTPEFKRDYVRLEVPGNPHMKADLCYVRRDRVREQPGMQLANAGTAEERFVVEAAVGSVARGALP